jgi:hypothetical protein
MRRTCYCLGFAGTAVVVFTLAWHTTQGSARPPEAGPDPAERGAPLPLSQVVLFNSGVGYFQREGTVEGDARIDLAFPASDVNDLLKSLVLTDLGQGHVSAVSYDSSEPVERTLKSFALDLTGNPTFGQVLNQARGERVEVTFQQGGAGTALTGTIVGMESAPDGPNKEVHVLNLLCAEGMRPVPLGQVQRLRFLNPTLDSEFRAALRVLASSHDSQKKAVRLQFNGPGQRPVRVGYVVESPIWKTSYRLVFDKAGRPTLQSWAVVENTTDEDWKDVRLALVSGRPLSFQMDLYPPLFVPRPKVEPELFASLRPPAYGGAIIVGGLQLGGQVGVQLGGAGGQQQLGFQGGANLGVGGGVAGFGGFGGGFGGTFQGGFQGLPVGNRYQSGQLGQFGGQAGGVAGENPNQRGPRLTHQELQERLKHRQEAREEARRVGSTLAAVDPNAAADSHSESLGDGFEHVLDHKVSLPRQKSALFPLPAGEIEGERVSIYCEPVHSRHPLLGLKFKNATGRPLMQGPVMVYEGGRFAGDARIADLQANEERLLAYAVDLGVEVKPEDRETPGPNFQMRMVKDDLNVSYSVRNTRTFVVRNRSKQDRELVIAHPIRASWKLAKETKPYEQTRDVYRFRTTVPAGKTIRFDVAEEQPRAHKFPATKVETEKGVTTTTFPTDLGVVVRHLTRVGEPRLTGVKVAKGLLKASSRHEMSVNYRIQNTSERPCEVTMEHQVLASRVLTGGAKPVPGSRDLFRFVLAPVAGVEAEQALTEQGEDVDLWTFTELSEDRAKIYLESSVASPAVKEILRQALRMRAGYQTTERQIEESKQAVKAITDEQVRLRANLERLPETSAAYKRYLEKFDTQETQLEKLAEQIGKLQASAKKQRQDFAAYVAAANAE